jgi:proline iminopeptidase
MYAKISAHLQQNQAMKHWIQLLILAFSLASCHLVEHNTEANTGQSGSELANYFNYGDTGVKAGGVRMIPIQTPVGEFKVWTKRFGNNPKKKILLLHGGPAFTHEYMEGF